jgi:hypothetical protein
MNPVREQITSDPTQKILEMDGIVRRWVTKQRGDGWPHFKGIAFRQVDHAESLVEQQQRHIQENLSLQQRLEEAETERNQLERELASARDRLERTRKDNMQVSKGLKAVLRIHDILVWIRIRGSMPQTNGSGCGSGSFYFHH